MYCLALRYHWRHEECLNENLPSAFADVSCWVCQWTFKMFFNYMHLLSLIKNGRVKFDEVLNYKTFYSGLYEVCVGVLLLIKIERILARNYGRL